MRNLFNKKLSKEVAILASVFIGLIISLVILTLHMRSDLIKKNSLNDAKLYILSLEKFRSVYTSEVVARIADKTEVKHDYHKFPGAIPLPATLSMKLGAEIGQEFEGAAVKLYSPYPFPWRASTGGLADEFANRAWEALQQKPTEDVFEFYESDAGLTLRYARADIMRESCVSCHNHHPDTPQVGWKVGDIRGVLEVHFPLEPLVKESTQLLLEVFALIGLILCCCFFLFFRMFRDSQHTANQLQFQAEHMNLEIEQRKEAQLEAIANQQAAEQANAAKGEFLSIMSHELRSPLNAILGFNGILKKKTPSDHPHFDFIDRIDKASKGLLRIINDILDFSKLEAGKLAFEYEPFDIKEVSTEIHSIFFETAKAKGIELSFTIDPDIPTTLYGDEIRLRQVLTNIISNAIKFTESGSVSCTIHLKSIEANDICLIFSVADTGIGMTANQIEVIFSPFEQAECATTRKYGGTGLGLSITRTLVRQMGGDISVESKEAGGSVFSWDIYLGLNEGTPPHHWDANQRITPQLPPNHTGTSHSKSEDSLHVLVCEHQPLLQKELCDLLTEFGVTFDAIDSGEHINKRLQTNTYDMIFVDINFPNKNAFEICQLNHGQPTPIIGIATAEDSDDAENCLLVGMQSYIQSPFGFDEIEKLLIANTPNR